jgi:mono/diheme cytochrome c family protein
MKTMKLALAALIAAAATGALAAPAANPPPRPVDSARLAAPTSKDATVQRGYKLYVDTGCWQCHGYQGGGSGAGPQIAAPMFPKVAFVNQLRNPRARMPIYTARVMPDADVDAIYAYLQTIPRGKAAADLPLITKMP